MPSFSHFFDTLFSSSDVFIRAMLLTLELTVVSILVGIIIGLLFALLKISNIKILAWISDTYVFLVRGTPLNRTDIHTLFRYQQSLPTAGLLGGVTCPGLP